MLQNTRRLSAVKNWLANELLTVCYLQIAHKYYIGFLQPINSECGAHNVRQCDSVRLWYLDQCVQIKTRAGVDTGRSDIKSRPRPVKSISKPTRGHNCNHETTTLQICCFHINGVEYFASTSFTIPLFQIQRSLLSSTCLPNAFRKPEAVN